MNWIGACDVGETCMAWTFLNSDTLVAEKMLLINMTIRGCEKLDLSPKSYGRIVKFWVDKYAEFFKRCRVFAIELQPQGVGRTKMHIIQAHLESCIACTYPHIRVVLTDPKLVRKHFNISGGTYAARKRKSVQLDAISDKDRKRMKLFFQKSVYSPKTKRFSTKSKIDDVVESALIALYALEQNPQQEPIKVALTQIDEPAVFLMERVQLRSTDASSY